MVIVGLVDVWFPLWFGDVSLHWLSPGIESWERVAGPWKQPLSVGHMA